MWHPPVSSIVCWFPLSAQLGAHKSGSGEPHLRCGLPFATVAELTQLAWRPRFPQLRQGCGPQEMDSKGIQWHAYPALSALLK